MPSPRPPMDPPGISPKPSERSGRVTRLNEELEARIGAMREFVATTSHELKSPLASIVGFASTLLHRWDSISDDDKRNYVAIIDNQAQRLGRLIDDLLVISQLQAGALASDRIRVNVRGAVRQAIAEVGESAAMVSLRVAEDLEVEADPHQLQQMLVNYLINALKYGGPPFEVEADEKGEFVEIRVRDCGPGVPEYFVPRLFEKFARADTPASRKERGTGLGLSVVEGLAGLNGGEAWYEPNRSNGACFAIQLPTAKE